MKIEAFGKTDVGVVRQSNEDSFRVLPDCNLYVVADGMGGHAAGEIASQIAVESMEKYFSSPAHTKGSPADRLRQTIELANRAVYDAGECDPSLNGMGSTIVVMHALPQSALIGYVGDSRAYLYRQGVVEQVTEDHSLVAEYVRQGLLTREAAARHPMRHVISRALGASPDVDPEFIKKIPCVGDIFLLCSDGLSNCVTPEEMAILLSQSRADLGKGADALLERAKEKGGPDNITILLVSYQA
jgi:protein phosphatase